MAPVRRRFRRQQPHRAFAVWAWTMLFVVLLSAVPTEGQARTRLVGSAFDPTTVSVALSPKQPKAKASLESSDRRRVPDSASGEPAQVAFITAPVAADPSAKPDAAPFVHSAPPDELRALTRAHGPRAPPRA